VYVRPYVRPEHKATDQLANPLARAMLDLPKGWTDPVRENAIATALLMFAPVIEGLQVRDGLEQGRYGLDARLFEDFYRASPTPIRVSLLNSPPAQYLLPDTFQRMYRETYQRPGLSTQEKHALSAALEKFLRHHPSCGPDYENEILDFFRNKHTVVIGMRLLGMHLTHVAAGDLGRLKRKLSAKDGGIRMTALQSLRLLLERHPPVEHPVAAFCTTPGLLRRAQSLSREDPDPHVRLQARHLLKGIRSHAPPARPPS